MTPIIPRPSAECERCHEPFKTRKGNANRFCSMPCSAAGRRSENESLIRLARVEWDRGSSATQIAQRLTNALGRNITKGVVSGITHRNEFPRRVKRRITP